MGILRVNHRDVEHLTNLVETLVHRIEERRIGRAEFAHMLNIEPETLDRRVREGHIERPFKDGRKSFWMLSYVQTIVKDTSNNANIATN